MSVYVLNVLNNSPDLLQEFQNLSLLNNDLYIYIYILLTFLNERQ